MSISDASTAGQTQAPAPLLVSAAEAARQVYGVSERTFHNMRGAGLVPAPVVLNGRTLRWVRSELQAAALALPRLSSGLAPEPDHLRAADKRGRRK